MAAIMASSSAFAGVKVQARVTAKNTRAKTVIMANSSGPKRVRASPATRLATPARRENDAFERGRDSIVVLTIESRRAVARSPRVASRPVAFSTRAHARISGFSRSYPTLISHRDRRTTTTDAPPSFL
jgi:hypothetical protein